MTLTVRPLEPRDRDAWLAARIDLWPDADPADLALEVDGVLAGQRDAVAAVLVATDGAALGFVELSLRPYADGCSSSPVAYVEAWWVAPASRRRGVGRALINAAEAWARGRGLAELASDALLANASGIAAHEAVGFVEVDRVMQFRKPLSR